MMEVQIGLKDHDVHGKQEEIEDVLKETY